MAAIDYAEALARVRNAGFQTTGLKSPTEFENARGGASAVAPLLRALSTDASTREFEALKLAKTALDDADIQAFADAVMKMRSQETFDVMKDVVSASNMVEPGAFTRAIDIAEQVGAVEDTTPTTVKTLLQSWRAARQADGYTWKPATGPTDFQLDATTKNASAEINPEKLHRMAHELAHEVKAIHESFCAEINKAQVARSAFNRKYKRLKDAGDKAVAELEVKLLATLVSTKSATCIAMKRAYNEASREYEYTSRQFLDKGRKVTNVNQRYTFSWMWLNVLCAFGKCIPDKNGDIKPAEDAFTSIQAIMAPAGAQVPNLKMLLEAARAITKVLDALNALPSKSDSRRALATSSEMSQQMYDDLPEYDDINSSAYRVFQEYNTDTLSANLAFYDLNQAQTLKELSKAMEQHSTKEQMAWWAAGRLVKSRMWKLIVATAKEASNVSTGTTGITLGQARELINNAVENLKRFGYNLTAEPAELPGFASMGAGGCLALRPGATAPAHKAFEWGAAHDLFRAGSYTINPQTLGRDGKAVEIRRLQQPVSVEDQLTGATGFGSLVLEGFGPTSGETSLFGGPSGDAASAWGAPAKQSNAKTNMLPSFDDQDGVDVGQAAVGSMTTGRTGGTGTANDRVVRGVFDGPEPIYRWQADEAARQQTGTTLAAAYFRGGNSNKPKRIDIRPSPAATATAASSSGLRS